MTRRRAGVAAAVLAFVLSFVGLATCGNATGDADGLTGEVVLSGSSTVEPISALVAELFATEHPRVAVRVDGPGTGDGFKLFCDDQIDIADASRPIRDEEAQACADAGVEYVELKVAIDGLSVITSRGNEAVDCLSFAQLYGLVGPESQGFDRWSDANPLVEEIGGTGDLPDLELDVVAPGEESGTYDSFVEIVLGDIAEQRVEAGAIDEEAAETVRKDYSSQANDNAIIDGVSGADSALGWTGFAFANQNRDQVKLLAVDGGAGCVGPSHETIADGSYPVARPLFLYVNTDRAGVDEAVAAYVDFYLSPEGYDAVELVDYVQLPPDQWDRTRAAWAATASPR